jgi:hypothetical protein
MAIACINSGDGMALHGKTAAGLPPKRQSVKASAMYCFFFALIMG